MTKSKSDDENGKDLGLDMSDLDPEEALRGFMEVDPEKVKERLKQGRGDTDSDARE